MNIETKTQTVTTYHLVLTEAELTQALVDPADLQSALRQARGATHAGRHGARNLTLGRKPGKAKQERPPAGPKGRGAAGRGKFAKQACPECGQMIAGSQMRQHRARKHGIAAGAQS